MLLLLLACTPDPPVTDTAPRDTSPNCAARCDLAACPDDPSCQERCFDGEDNELDGLTDCADPECASDSWCDEASWCSDGRDNDLDGRTDCEDGDCWGLCTETACEDGRDDDYDGPVDCQDDDCIGTSACNGVDRLAVSGGTALHRHNSWWGSTSSSGATSIQDTMTVYSATGSAQIQRSSATYTCDWTLAGLRLRAWRSPFWSSQVMSGSVLSTTGACAGRLGTSPAGTTARVGTAGTTTA